MRGIALRRRTLLGPAASGGSEGPNLLDAQSSGFESSSEPVLGVWAAWYNSSAFRSTFTSKSGLASMRVVANDPVWGITFNNWPGSTGIGPGTRTIKASGVTAGANLTNAVVTFRFRNDSGTDLAVGTLTFTLTGSWQTLSDTVVAPTGTSRVYMEIAGNNASIGDEAYFDDFYVG